MQFELSDPRLWVGVAFLAFFVLFYRKLAAGLTGALDNRSSAIAAELNEVRRLRDEANAVLTQYKIRQQECAVESAAILASARKDADSLREFAEKDLRASLDARTKQAMDRIAREEESAVAEVRNHVVDMALTAARTLIADQVEKLSHEEQVTLALSDIERKIH